MTNEEIRADRRRHQKKLNHERFKRFLWFTSIFISIFVFFEYYENLLILLPLLFLQFYTFQKLKKIDHSIRVLKLCVLFLEVAEDPSDKNKLKEISAIFRKQ